MLKLRCIRAFDNRKAKEQIKISVMSEERKRQIKKRVLLKIKCIRAFDNRKTKKFVIHKNARYENTLT